MVCTLFTKGQCQRGNFCPYRHLRADRTIVCKHWLRGLCKKGDQCEFLHEFDMAKMPECYFYARFSKFNVFYLFLVIILFKPFKFDWKQVPATTKNALSCTSIPRQRLKIVRGTIAGFVVTVRHAGIVTYAEYCACLTQPDSAQTGQNANSSSNIFKH